MPRFLMALLRVTAFNLLRLKKAKRLRLSLPNPRLRALPNSCSEASVPGFKNRAEALIGDPVSSHMSPRKCAYCPRPGEAISRKVFQIRKLNCPRGLEALHLHCSA